MSTADALTLDERATNFDTMKHIHRVRDLLNDVVIDLLHRGSVHDKSKLESPEVELFTEYTPKLANVTYGSAEYEELRRKLEPALKHHYARNSHHAEFWANGINDMSLMDIVEMFCDWKAASERHNDGNILKSIEINATRFGMSPQLTRIFENTAKVLFNK